MTQETVFAAFSVVFTKGLWVCPKYIDVTKQNQVCKLIVFLELIKELIEGDPLRVFVTQVLIRNCIDYLPGSQSPM